MMHNIDNKALLIGSNFHLDIMLLGLWVFYSTTLLVTDSQSIIWVIIIFIIIGIAVYLFVLYLRWASLAYNQFMQNSFSFNMKKKILYTSSRNNVKNNSRFSYYAKIFNIQNNNEKKKLNIYSMRSMYTQLSCIYT